MEESPDKQADHLLTNFIGYSQGHGDILNKFTDEYLLMYFDRFKIDQAVRKIQSHQKELCMAEFVRLFLSLIEHKPNQTLYLTISLIRLFHKIKEEAGNDKGVKFANFTSFLCNKISEGDPDLVVAMKEIPMEQVAPDASRLREIDLSPPPILRKVQMQVPKIIKNKNKKDKKLDEKKPVSEFVYSETLNSIIALGRLSSSISIYDPLHLQQKAKIIPSACKLMSKDVAILSLAFSERDLMIGCIINNIGITFWDAADNFNTEKVLGSTRSDQDLKVCGDKIYFLKLHQEWITTDKDTIYFWDLKEEKVSRTIKRGKATAINTVCQINHLRSLLVSYTSHKVDERSLVLYHNYKQISKLVVDNSGCHTLLYNQATQLVVLLGYSNSISVYQIDVRTFDINLVTTLKAHTSILTCVANIPNSPMIMSGDDTGQAKLWDLNYMRCLQGIQIAKSLVKICFSREFILYADSRINSITLENAINGRPKQHKKADETYGIFQFCRKEEGSLWIITRREARQVSLITGRVKNIFVLCDLQEQISAVGQLTNGFAIGTSKGQLSKYDFGGNRKWKITAHEGQISQIKPDRENHMIATVGRDNNLIVWSEKAIGDNEAKWCKKVSFRNRDINLLEISPYANLAITGSTSSNTIQLWNYDTFKLAKIIELPAAVSSFIILPDKQVIIVGSVNGQLSAIEYFRKEIKLQLKLISTSYIDSMADKTDSGSGKLADFAREDSEQRNYIIDIAYCEDANLLVGITPCGQIHCFSPKHFVSSLNYQRQYEPSPSIKRSSPTEDYEHELMKNQYAKLTISEMQIKSNLQEIQLLWSQRIHKETSQSVGLLNLSKKYACTLSSDGYCKIAQITRETGTIVCSLKLMYPLPVKWQIEFQNYCGLKQQLHEAIAIINTIVRNYEFELSIKQRNDLNVIAFLEQMLSGGYEVRKPNADVQIMSQQYSYEDIRGHSSANGPSLKSLEAYKRLQLIKRQNSHNLKQNSSLQVPPYQTDIAQKQAIKNYFSPSYLPKIMNKGLIESEEDKRNSQWGNTLVKKIDDIMDSKDILRNRDDKQNNISPFKNYSQAVSKMAKSVKHDQNKMASMSVSQILGKVNYKLLVSKRLKPRKLQQSCLEDEASNLGKSEIGSDIGSFWKPSAPSDIGKFRKSMKKLKLCNLRKSHFH